MGMLPTQCWPQGSWPQAGVKPGERGTGGRTGTQRMARFLYHDEHQPCGHTPAQAASLNKMLHAPCPMSRHSYIFKDAGWGGHNPPQPYSGATSHRASFPQIHDAFHQGLSPSRDEPHPLQWEVLLMAKPWNHVEAQEP